MSFFGPIPCGNCGAQDGHGVAACPNTASNWWNGTVVCTCPTVWHGIYPPPPCPACEAKSADNTVAGGGINWPTLVGTTTASLINSSTNVEAAMQELAKAIGARIGANGIGDRDAAFDAWQEALAMLAALRQSVERAVLAEAAK